MQKMYLVALLAITLPLKPSASAAAPTPLALDVLALLLKRGDPTDIDAQLTDLEQFFANHPDDQNVQATILRIIPFVRRMSRDQRARVEKLYISLISHSRIPNALAGEADAKNFQALQAGCQFWFKHVAKAQVMLFNLTRELHAFILAISKYQIAGKERKVISALAHQTLNQLPQPPFPPELTDIIGQYTTPDRCPDIDSLLIQIYSVFGSRLNQETRSAGNIFDNIVAANSMLFERYRKSVDRSGVAWPLSDAERTRWESTGFVYIPMMIKRDTLRCMVCYPDGTPADKVQTISGLLYINHDYKGSHGLSYMDPADHHNYSIRHPNHEAMMARAILDPGAPTCKNMPNPSTPEFLRYILRRVNLRAIEASKLPSDTTQQDLRNAALLWQKLNTDCTSFMGWSLAASFFDAREQATFFGIYKNLYDSIMFYDQK
jgi:hypothetical protein